MPSVIRRDSTSDLHLTVVSSLCMRIFLFCLNWFVSLLATDSLNLEKMASHKGNLYSEIPTATRSYPNEVISKLMDTHSSNGGSAMKIERIVSSGHTTDYVSQDDDEFVVLLQGQAKVIFQGTVHGVENVQELKIGDYLFIPKGTRHRVAETSKDPLAVW